MMKRTGVPRLGPDESAPLVQQNPNQIQQPGASNMHTLPQSAQPQILGSTAMLSVGGGSVGNVGGFGRSAGRGGGQVINYLKTGAVQFAPKQPNPHQHPQPMPHQQGLPHNSPQPPRIKTSSMSSVPGLGRQSPAPAPAPIPGGAPLPQHPQHPQHPPGAQFQRLKVEDALSYLDQVKYKFNTQPQVYNDFLDIMKEFKSQTIDTPGVITRVSNLFKGHPELIVGFNTFLPPGYKIEVQSNGQVSVSMPSPTGGVVMGVHHPPPQPPHLVHLLPVPPSVSPAIVHNLSVSSSTGNTLHQISAAHQQMEAAIHHQQPGGQAGGNTSNTPGQPVEFNHAIEYVNKIKSRFSRQPDKYKRFLEILHAYQRGQRDVKEPQAKQQTEQEVYSQVAKLFENQEDLLAEFGQFLPDAKAVTKAPPPHDPRLYRAPSPHLHHLQGSRPDSEAERGPSPPHHHLHHVHPQVPKHNTPSSTVPIPSTQHHLKRSPSFTSTAQLPSGGPPCKKPRVSGGGALRDVSYAEAAKLATAHDLEFFDRARVALKHQPVYDNFLRCLVMFTNEVVSSTELVHLTAPFLCRHPDLHKWFQEFLGPPSPPHTPPAHLHTTGYPTAGRSSLRYEAAGTLAAQLRHDRPHADAAIDIDLTTCKRLGTSYCALPREAASRRCSGRTPLCKEVLNDTWVSFPTWSEDSTFVTSRKTQYEEYIYRCEDERFELDVVIETNASTIRVLEGVQKKLTRMSSEEASKYRLDDCLGGHSPTIHQRALRRIYGDKVAVDIIAGLKKNPVVAVPVVLRRLKAKEEEWREAQKGFNKQWREQNEKYYLKSLDHQGINFKQNDQKAMRSKSLFNEVESAYAARRPGPHLVVDYNMTSRQEAIKIVRDTAELLIHHARRQTGIQKAEKRRIKQLLRHFLPDLFSHPRQPLSDDERDDEEKEERVRSPDSPEANLDDKPPIKQEIKQEIKHESSESDNASDKSGKNNKNKENKPKNNNNTDNKDGNSPCLNVKRSSSDDKLDRDNEDDDCSDHPSHEGRFVCTSSWYLFLRVHGTLCQRLAAARRAARAAANDCSSVAAALRLKPNNLPAEVSSPSEYYSVLLELVKGVLDGNVEASSYEDAAREMLGIKAYPAYTLDKLVTNAVRQLQHCVSEPWSVRAMELARGGMRGAPGYVRKAARYLRHHHTAFLVRVYGGDDCKVTYEVLEVAGEGRSSPQHDASRLSPAQQSGAAANGEAVSRLAAWSLYTERFSRPDIQDPLPARHKPVFLVRNARARGAPPAPRVQAAAAPRVQTPAGPRNPRARRKPPKICDTSECTLSPALRCRAVAFRPMQLYVRGCLRAARSTHARLHATRRDRFRAWLHRQHTDCH